MTMHRVLLAFALVSMLPLLWAQSAAVDRWNVHDYPDPHSYDTFRLCQRGNQSNICDPDGILSKQEADEVDGLIRSVYRETRCGCRNCIDESRGYIIRVALMLRMQRILSQNNDTYALLHDARQYAYTLSRRWMMSGSCNESLLILFSKYDGILYTLTLPHARLRLSDQHVNRIMLNVRPLFDNDDTVGEGLKEMILRYRMALEGKTEEAIRPQPWTEKSKSGTSGFSPSSLVPLILFLMTSLVIQ